MSEPNPNPTSPAGGTTQRILWGLLGVGLVVAVAMGLWLDGQGKLVYKPHFEDKSGIAGLLGTLADQFPLFYGVVGFVSLLAILLLVPPIGHLLRKPEGIYDDEGDPAAADAGGEGPVT